MDWCWMSDTWIIHDNAHCLLILVFKRWFFWIAKQIKSRVILEQSVERFPHEFIYRTHLTSLRGQIWLYIKLGQQTKAAYKSAVILKVTRNGKFVTACDAINLRSMWTREAAGSFHHLPDVWKHKTIVFFASEPERDFKCAEECCEWVVSHLKTIPKCQKPRWRCWCLRIRLGWVIWPKYYIIIWVSLLHNNVYIMLEITPPYSFQC